LKNKNKEHFEAFAKSNKEFRTLNDQEKDRKSEMGFDGVDK